MFLIIPLKKTQAYMTLIVQYLMRNFFNSVNKTSKPLDKNCRISMILDIMMILQFLSSGFEVLLTELVKFDYIFYYYMYTQLKVKVD